MQRFPNYRGTSGAAPPTPGPRACINSRPIVRHINASHVDRARHQFYRELPTPLLPPRPKNSILRPTPLPPTLLTLPDGASLASDIDGPAWVSREIAREVLRDWARGGVGIHMVMRTQEKESRL